MSSMSENPTKAVPKSACRTKSPGINASTAFPTKTPWRLFRSGMNKTKYISGWNMLAEDKDWASERVLHVSNKHQFSVM